MKVPLLDVAIELTNHCQLKCKMCWSQSPKLNPPRPKGYMSFKLFKQIVDELKTYWESFPVYHKPHGKRAPFTICLSFGGESLSHPYFKQFIEYLIDTGLWCHKVIYTNGILIDKYVDILAEHFYRIHISIHSPLNMQVIDNIKLLKKKRATHGKPAIFSTIVYNEFTQSTLPTAIQKVNPFVDILSGQRVITEDLRYADNYQRPHKCEFPFYYMAILWNGDTLPCCRILSSGSFSMGNIKDGLENVWNNKKYEDLRNGQTKGYPCEGCKISQGLLNPLHLQHAIYEGSPTIKQL